MNTFRNQLHDTENINGYSGNDLETKPRADADAYATRYTRLEQFLKCYGLAHLPQTEEEINELSGYLSETSGSDARLLAENLETIFNATERFYELLENCDMTWDEIHSVCQEGYLSAIKYPDSGNLTSLVFTRANLKMCIALGQKFNSTFDEARDYLALRRLMKRKELTEELTSEDAIADFVLKVEERSKAKQESYSLDKYSDAEEIRKLFNVFEGNKNNPDELHKARALKIEDLNALEATKVPDSIWDKMQGTRAEITLRLYYGLGGRNWTPEEIHTRRHKIALTVVPNTLDNAKARRAEVENLLGSVEKINEMEIEVREKLLKMTSPDLSDPKTRDTKTQLEFVELTDTELALLTFGSGLRYYNLHANEIGIMLGVTKQRISDLNKEGLHKLKELFNLQK